MLEDLAYQYSALPADQIRAISFGLVVIGGLLSAFTNRSEAELARAPYFAYYGMIFLFITLASFAAVTFIVQAMVWGFFWVAVGVEMLGSIAGGYLFAHIATARSRDAVGHGRMAPLAFIPLLNFWLLLKPSKNAASVNRMPTIPLLSGGLGVLTGFILLAAALGLKTFTELEGERRVAEAGASGVFLSNKNLLKRTLAEMVTEIKEPIKVDEVTSLLRAEARGEEVTYTYEVDTTTDSIPESMRTELIGHVCSDETMGIIIAAGAEVKYRYLRKDGTEIGAVHVARAVCAKYN